MEIGEHQRVILENPSDLGLAQMLLEPNMDVRAKLPIKPEYPYLTGRFVHAALERALNENYRQDGIGFSLREAWRRAEADVVDLLSDPA